MVGSIKKNMTEKCGARNRCQYVNLVPSRWSSLRIALSTIYRSAAIRLEWNFAFFSTISTYSLMHFSWFSSSIRHAISPPYQSRKSQHSLGILVLACQQIQASLFKSIGHTCSSFSWAAFSVQFFSFLSFFFSSLSFYSRVLNSHSLSWRRKTF